MAPANDLRRVTGFEGNYGAYIEDLKRRKGPDADMPTRIKYKKLVRS
jgi:sulfate-transporting ATPase